MALVSIWSLDPNRGWIAKLVDPDSLRPRTPENYWMFKVMDKPPSASLTPPHLRPLARESRIPSRPAGTDYKKLAAEIKKRTQEYDRKEREAKAWAAKKTARLRHDIAAMAKRMQRKADANALTLVHFASGATADHEFIEAMFSLYSQQRSRMI